MAEAAAPRRLPWCPRCHRKDALIREDTPDFPHINSYRCSACQYFWMTNRRGLTILVREIDYEWWS